jgi:hypothetical protein
LNVFANGAIRLQAVKQSANATVARARFAVARREGVTRVDDKRRERDVPLRTAGAAARPDRAVVDGREHLPKGAPVDQLGLRRYAAGCSEGAYEMPTIEPSGESSRATV